LFPNGCLAYEILNGLDPPPLREFLSLRSDNSCLTRAALIRDRVINFRKTAFSQSAFSIKASKEWNDIPTSVRELKSYNGFRSSFNTF